MSGLPFRVAWRCMEREREKERERERERERESKNICTYVDGCIAAVPQCGEYNCISQLELSRAHTPRANAASEAVPWPD